MAKLFNRRATESTRLVAVGAVSQGTSGRPNVTVWLADYDSTFRVGRYFCTLSPKPEIVPASYLRLMIPNYTWINGPSHDRMLIKERHGNIRRAYAHLTNRTMDFVSGGTVWDVGSPSALRNTAYLKIHSTSYLSRGGVGDSDIYIPCSEIFRTFYAATTETINNTLNGRLLLESEAFDFPNTIATTRGLVKISSRSRGGPNGVSALANPIQREYIYLQLRRLSWKLISQHQQGRPLQLEIAPPFLGDWHIEGDLLSEQTGPSSERIVVLSLGRSHREHHLSPRSRLAEF